MELVYKGRNNTIDLGLIINGKAENANVPTRYILDLKNVDTDADLVFDSDITAAIFDTTTKKRVHGQKVYILLLVLGQEATLGVGTWDANLISYDPANLLGVNWPEFRLEVKDNSL